MIIENSKSELRKIGKNIRSKIDPFLREKYSHEINQYICTTDYFLNAENISFYLPMKDEVDVWPLIEQSWKLNKNVFSKDVNIIDAGEGLASMRFIDAVLRSKETNQWENV